MALTFNPCTWDERQIDLGVFQVSLVYIHKENRINRQIKLFLKILHCDTLFPVSKISDTKNNISKPTNKTKG